MFDDYCCCSVHIDHHSSGDWETKSSRRNRNDSVFRGLSQDNIDKYENTITDGGSAATHSKPKSGLDE